MSMTAVEANDLANSVNMKNLNNKIDEYDQLILEAANNGVFYIMTEFLSRKMQKAIQDYYEGLGYTVTVLENHHVTIEW